MYKFGSSDASIGRVPVPTIENGVLRTREVAAESGLGAPMRVATAVAAERASRAIAAALAEL